MSDPAENFRSLLVARQKELTSQIVPLQTALDEVNRLLRVAFPGALIPASPVNGNGETVSSVLRMALSNAGDLGLSTKDATAIIGVKSNASSRLSVLKARGEANLHNGHYILKPEFRVARAEDVAP